MTIERPRKPITPVEDFGKNEALAPIEESDRMHWEIEGSLQEYLKRVKQVSPMHGEHSGERVKYVYRVPDTPAFVQEVVISNGMTVKGYYPVVERGRKNSFNTRVWGFVTADGLFWPMRKDGLAVVTTDNWGIKYALGEGINEIPEVIRSDYTIPLKNPIEVGENLIAYSLINPEYSSFKTDGVPRERILERLKVQRWIADSLVNQLESTTVLKDPSDYMI